MIKIYIPVYNPNIDALKMTLNSVFSSKCDFDFRVFIIDNNSDCDFSEIKKCYPKANIINYTKTVGRIENWNRCLDSFYDTIMNYREGEVMKFIFVGDTIEPNCLSDQYKLIKKGFDIVSSAHHVHPYKGDSYVMNHCNGGDMILTAEEAIVLSQLKGNWLAGCMACPMFRSGMAIWTRLDETMSWASDWKFWTDLMARAKSIYYINKPLVNFNAQHRAHFLSTKSDIQKKEEELMKAYLSKVNKSL